MGCTDNKRNYGQWDVEQGHVVQRQQAGALRTKGKGGTAARAAVATDGLVCGRRRGSLHVPDYPDGQRKGGWESQLQLGQVAK